MTKNGATSGGSGHVPVLYSLLVALFCAQIFEFVYLTWRQKATEATVSVIQHRLGVDTGFGLPSHQVPRTKRQVSTAHEKQWDQPADLQNSENSAAFDGAKVEVISRGVGGKDSGRKAGDLEEGEQPDKPWVWLTDYARIPLLRMQEFCAATKDYCPPGAPGERGLTGLPGESGAKGEKGDKGIPGIEGVVGPPGLPGLQGITGLKGESGKPGMPGLDGLDGLPGEPGLDGIPGRSGIDGLAGLDGIPGSNGIPGSHGKDGAKGDKGDIGLQGPPGDTGMSGPRGRQGKDGADGVPGIPGINATLVNTTRSTLLIPPWIAKTPRGDEIRVIRVSEGDNLRLRCVAAGVPRPTIEWSKADSTEVLRGAWKSTSVGERELELIAIHRSQRGLYRCTATNGVPPDATKLYQVTVTFSPLISCQNNQLSVKVASSVLLQCSIEASPPFVNYWRFKDKVLENDAQYSIKSEEVESYQVKLSLEIHSVTNSDYGNYYCVSKNEVGSTEAGFNVLPPGAMKSLTRNRLYFGLLPPNITDQDNLCPVPQQPSCRKCPSMPYSSLFGYSDLFGSRVANVTRIDGLDVSGVENRTVACELSAVGKPVFNRECPQQFGTWLQDALPPTMSDAEKFWYTHEDQRTMLFEYSNQQKFDKKQVTRNISLPSSHQGNGHVVYNGSFFYHSKDTDTIVRFDLRQSRITHRLRLPGLMTNESLFLYGSNYTYADFAVDENGLWVIYALPNNNIGVVKLESDNLQPLQSWNISFIGDSHTKDGDMIIVCGVLYGIRSSRNSNTKFSLALDLFTLQPINFIDLTFTNPFRQTTMVGYSPKNKEIFSWDRGNQLTYPIKYIAQDQETAEEVPNIEALLQAPDFDIEDSNKEQ